MSSAIETLNLNHSKQRMDLFDELEGNLNDSFRRMSIDSGLSMSPTASVPSPSDASQQRRKKKKRIRSTRFSATTFHDAYSLKGEILGEGSYGRVETCIFQLTGHEFAVKIVSKTSPSFSRAKIMKEIELYYLCRGQLEIIQLEDFFEDQDNFYLIFEKAYGGPLLTQIQQRIHFTEHEASAIIKDLARALAFLHERGIAHRDLKPENILCLKSDSPCPIKLCDFDLCSSVNQTISTPRLQSPVGSAEYMAPEVVEIFDFDDLYDLDAITEEEANLTYDKRCDLWSLGIIAYILLCGYTPFQGSCGTDCGWNDRGEACYICQQKLFSAIKNGNLEFPQEDWSTISSEARDLISKLLVREASQRLDASEVLRHPWIVNGGPSNHLLETPQVLRRQQSVKEFSDFASNALTIKRNVESPFSFTRALLSSVDNERAVKKSITSNDLVADALTSLTSLKNRRNASASIKLKRRQTSDLISANCRA